MNETLEQWADDHGETGEEYLIADAESERKEALKQMKTRELVNYGEDYGLLMYVLGVDDWTQLREKLIEGIIELNLDLE